MHTQAALGHLSRAQLCLQFNSPKARQNLGSFEALFPTSLKARSDRGVQFSRITNPPCQDRLVELRRWIHAKYT